MEAVDKYTLRITMKKPSVLLPALAGYFNGIPMLSPKSIENHGKDWVRKPSGTGPFKLKTLIPGDRIVLEKKSRLFQKGIAASGRGRIPYHERSPDDHDGPAHGSD